MGTESITLVEIEWYHWIAYIIVAILGGAAGSFVNNKGLLKMWKWEEQDNKNLNLGIIADIIIGVVAAIGILWMMTPQTRFQFLGIGAIGGYGGSSILRALVNRLEADVNMEKAQNYKGKAETSDIVGNSYIEISSKDYKRLENIKTYLSETNNHKILEDLLNKDLLK